MFKEYLKLILSSLIDFDYFKCQVHSVILKKYLINQISRFFIYTYCKNVNKIIIGKRDVDDENDNIQILAKTYFNKCRKK